MFTLPPWPPKDYALKNVARNMQSAPDFTPSDLPRTTQSNLAKYLHPIEYQEFDKVKPEIKEVHKKILENWSENSKAWWVDKPGENAFFLHKLHKQCDFDKGEENNPIYQHKERIFNRPFSFEFDCVELERLKKIQTKSDAESAVKCEAIKKIENDKFLKKQEEASIKVVPCKKAPPFWWKGIISQDGKEIFEKDNFQDQQETTYQNSYKLWQEPPSFFKKFDDPCELKKELSMVGIPFRNEGCNWYYKNYPPSNIKFRVKKFSK